MMSWLCVGTAIRPPTVDVPSSVRHSGTDGMTLPTVARGPWKMADEVCAYCHTRPCNCKLATTECACGTLLMARNDLDSKRLAAVEHVGTARHQTWRGRQRW